MVRDGIEPPPFRFSGERSCQLSYLTSYYVGTARFERATSWTQTRRAAKLRYVPDGG